MVSAAANIDAGLTNPSMATPENVLMHFSMTIGSWQVYSVFQPRQSQIVISNRSLQGGPAVRMNQRKIYQYPPESPRQECSNPAVCGQNSDVCIIEITKIGLC